MIFSEKLKFSDGQTVAANAVSTNVIDLGAAGTPLGAPAALEQDIGKGRPIPIVIQIDVDAAGTNPTLDVDLQVDADEAFSDPTVVASAQQIGDVTAGHRVTIFYVPQGTNERFLRLDFTIGGTGNPEYVVTAGIALADSQS